MPWIVYLFSKPQATVHHYKFFSSVAWLVVVKAFMPHREIDLLRND